MLFMYLGHLVAVYSFVQDGLASCMGGWRICVWLEDMCVVGGYVWLRFVVDGCGQLDGCGWFWSVRSCGMSVVLGGVW